MIKAHFSPLGRPPKGQPVALAAGAQSCLAFLGVHDLNFSLTLCHPLMTLGRLAGLANARHSTGRWTEFMYLIAQSGRPLDFITKFGEVARANPHVFDQGPWSKQVTTPRGPSVACYRYPGMTRATRCTAIPQDPALPCSICLILAHDRTTAIKPPHPRPLVPRSSVPAHHLPLPQSTIPSSFN